ncbi:MAG: hypothetical protein KDE33_01410 [Bacteroidetes bacterium]|nr:hypothetical protein [Bacteroidota bacterium]
MIKVRHFCYLFLALVSCNSSSNDKNINSNSKQYTVDRKYDLEKISNCLTFNDISEFNNHINSELGITVLFSIGVNPIWSILDSINLDSERHYIDSRTPKVEIPNWILNNINTFITNEHSSNFQIEDSLIFECEEIFKYGSFIDESESKSIMTNSIKESINIAKIDGNEENEFSFLNNELKNYQKVESNSVRLVFTSTNQPKIFAIHLTKIDGKYYIWLLDFYSIDCSV